MPKPLQESPPELGSVFWPTTLFVNALKVQQHQWQTMFAWQETMAEMHRDLYDRWASQWAGAARLDD